MFGLSRRVFILLLVPLEVLKLKLKIASVISSVDSSLIKILVISLALFFLLLVEYLIISAFLVGHGRMHGWCAFCSRRLESLAIAGVRRGRGKLKKNWGR